MNTNMTDEKLLEKGCYDQVRRVVEHEDNLINHRFSWLVLAQSFLLMAWYTGNKTGFPEYLLIAAGLASSFLPYISILAAIGALNSLRTHEWSRAYKRSERFPPLTSDARRHISGLVGAGITPLVFILAWLLIIFYVTS